MNTREVPPKKRFVPAAPQVTIERPTAEIPESVVFDKAEEAESIQTLHKNLEAISKEIEELERSKKSAKDRSRAEDIEAKITGLERERERLKEVIAHRETEAKKDDD
jgi:TolA-binding protein